MQAQGGHGSGGTVTLSPEGCSSGCPMRSLRPYFNQGRGGDDSYDPSLAIAIVLGPSAQIMAFVMKIRDGMGVEPLCVCGGAANSQWGVGRDVFPGLRTCLW